MTVPSAPTQEITTKQRLMLFVLPGAGFMLSVDFAIMTVALPRLGAGVGLSLASLPWVAAAYALPAAGFTLLFGRLADLFGRRRQFMAGMFLLIGASLLGGFAPRAALPLTDREIKGDPKKVLYG